VYRGGDNPADSERDSAGEDRHGGLRSWATSSKVERHQQPEREGGSENGDLGGVNETVSKGMSVIMDGAGTGFEPCKST
jgi:hypothetical protein